MNNTELNTMPKDALLVVSAKEHGKIFHMQNGEINEVHYVEEHPPEYSDNEGMMRRSTASGATASMGIPKEETTERNLERYFQSLAEEIKKQTENHNIETILVIEPEHLKGQVASYTKLADNVTMHTILHGNHVKDSITQIKDLVHNSFETTSDPRDPASAEGEENAEEKKKILSVGQQ